MTLAALMTDLVPLAKPVVALDDYGSQVLTYPTLTEVPSWVERIAAAEDAVDRDREIERVRLWFHPEQVVEAHDRVTVDGSVYEVEGPALVHRNPRTGVTSHSVVVAVRTDG